MTKYSASTMLGTAFLTTGCEDIGDSIYMVNAGMCDGCGDCLSACNFNAIVISKTATILGSKCMGCGKCVSPCKKGAISKS